MKKSLLFWLATLTIVMLVGHTSNGQIIISNFLINSGASVSVDAVGGTSTTCNYVLTATRPSGSIDLVGPINFYFHDASGNISPANVSASINAGLWSNDVSTITGTFTLDDFKTGYGTYINIFCTITDNSGNSTLASNNVAINRVTTPPASNTPTITTLTPGSGQVGSVITIVGTNLTGATNVKFNGTTAPTYTVNSAGTQITVTVPTGATSGNVTVTTPHGTCTGPGAFTVTSPSSTSPPVITSLGSIRGGVGDSFGINGSGFSANCQVSFNGTTTTSISRISSSFMIVWVPVGATTGNVVVTNSYGVSNGVLFTVIVFPAQAFPCDNNITLAGTIICSYQNIFSGSTPATITGRALSNTSDSDYQTFWQDNGSQTNTNDFLSPQGETVQWQSSSDNQSWTNISGANARNYSPGPTFSTTYYRRLSYRSQGLWYTSNTVTITVNGPVTSIVYIRNRFSGQVLDVGNNTAVGAIAFQQGSRGTLGQQWVVAYQGSSAYQISNGLSYYSLAIQNVSMNTGSYIVQDNMNSNISWNQWEFYPVSGAPNCYVILNRISTLVLTTQSSQPGAAAIQDVYRSGHLEQEWELIPVAPVAGGAQFPGVYTITNHSSFLNLEIDAFSTNNGTPATQNTYSYADNQHWTIQETTSLALNNAPVNTGPDIKLAPPRPRIFKIVNRHSGLALGVSTIGNVRNSGQSIVQSPYDRNAGISGNSPQQWSIDYISSNLYRITNRASHLVLEMPRGSNSPSQAADQDRNYGAAYQMWGINEFALNRTDGSGPTHSVDIFPNPADDRVDLVLTTNDAGSVEAEDKDGPKVGVDYDPEIANDSTQCANTNYVNEPCDNPDDNPDTTDASKDDTTTHVWVYDYTGALKYEVFFGVDGESTEKVTYVKSDDNKTELNTKEWPDGIYYVRISSYGIVTSSQLSVEH